jgi:hypothetical protein
VKPPIFVRADEPLLIYRTAKDATRCLEWIDIEDAIYTAYDGDGKLLKFDLRHTKTRLLGFIPVTAEEVVLSDAEAEPTHQDELRRALIDGLVARGEPSDALASLPLADLQALAVERLGFDSPAW